MLGYDGFARSFLPTLEGIKTNPSNVYRYPVRRVHKFYFNCHVWASFFLTLFAILSTSMRLELSRGT